jgi:hypothetical protein
MMSPVRPGSMISAAPAVAAVTTGSPHAIASLITMPKASYGVGKTKTSAAA